MRNIGRPISVGKGMGPQVYNCLSAFLVPERHRVPCGAASYALSCNQLLMSSNRKKNNKNTKRTKKVVGRGAYRPGGRVLGGQGGFFDDISSFLSPVVKIGKTIGTIANTAGRLLGNGAYTPAKNSILASPVPDVHSSTDNGIRYRHKEYLGDLTGSVAWENVRFPVNPGLAPTFPWLSGLAGGFQKYRIEGLVFCIKSTTSAAIASSTNLSMGTVLGAFQYNSYDSAPTSKVDFLTLSGSVTGKPSDDQIFPMECDRNKNLFPNLLVRTTGVSDDLTKYDHAVFNLATVGFQAEYPLGELWVSYDIVLSAPKTETSLPWFCGTLGSTYMVPQPLSSTLMLADVKFIETNTMKMKREATKGGINGFEFPAGSSGLYFMSFHAEVNLQSALGDAFAHLDPLELNDMNYAFHPQFQTQATARVAGATAELTEIGFIKFVLDDETRPGTVAFGWNPAKAEGVVSNILSFQNVTFTLTKVADDFFARGTTASSVSLARKFGRLDGFRFEAARPLRLPAPDAGRETPERAPVRPASPRRYAQTVDESKSALGLGSILPSASKADGQRFR